MTCQQVQTKLSLYLYGELDFAEEEEVERHVGECALCERALAREKTWHTTLNGGQTDVPLDLLARCRRELKTVVSRSGGNGGSYARRLWRWAAPFGFSTTRWSMRLAAASLLIFAGFTAARWIDRNGLPGSFGTSGLSEEALINPPSVKVRDIQPGSNDRVRILVDQIREGEVTGRVDDAGVRQLLLAATRDSADPGIRVDSVEMLNGQNGDDVRDTLIHSVEHDPNAAVRLKALESLRSFAADSSTRSALKFVLEHDENPGVRTEAIDVLAPADEKMEFSPDLAGALQDVMRSGRDDDYVHMRCLQVLREMKASLDVY